MVCDKIVVVAICWQHIGQTMGLPAYFPEDLPNLRIFYAISKLRKAGVNDTSLTHFYQSRIIPIITYVAPMWYPLISQCDRERLEKYQRLCLRIILLHVDGTETRLAMTGLDDIKGEGNFQNSFSWLNTGPPLLPKYIGEKAHNAPKVKLLALK